MTDPIEQLLREADMSNESALHSFLSQIQEEATSVRPIPSAELAVLLLRRAPQSRLRRRRVAIATLIVIGVVGAGATAAAASPALRSATQQLIQTVTGVAPSAPLRTKSKHGNMPSTPHPTTSSTPGRPSATTHTEPSDHPGPTGNPSTPYPGQGTTHMPTSPGKAPSAPTPAIPGRP